MMSTLEDAASPAPGATTATNRPTSMSNKLDRRKVLRVIVHQIKAGKRSRILVLIIDEACPAINDRWLALDCPNACLPVVCATDTKIRVLEAS